MLSRKLLSISLLALTGINHIACNRTEDPDTKIQDESSSDIDSLHKPSSQNTSLFDDEKLYIQGIDTKHKAILSSAKNPQAALNIAISFENLINSIPVQDLEKILKEDSLEKMKLKFAMVYLHQNAVLSDSDIFAYEKEFATSSHSREKLIEQYSKLGIASPINLTEDIANGFLSPKQAKNIWLLKENPHLGELRKSCIIHDLSFSDKELKENQDLPKLIAEKKKNIYLENKDQLSENRKKIFDYAFKLGINESKIYDAFRVGAESGTLNTKLDYEFKTTDKETPIKEGEAMLGLVQENLKKIRRIAEASNQSNSKAKLEILSLVAETILDDFRKPNHIDQASRMLLSSNLARYFSNERIVNRYQEMEDATLSFIDFHQKYKAGEIKNNSSETMGDITYLRRKLSEEIAKFRPPLDFDYEQLSTRHKINRASDDGDLFEK